MFIDSKQRKWQISEREDGSIFVSFENSAGDRVIVYDTAGKLRLMDRNTRLRWWGVFFAALGVLGYLTVADDLAHTGELVGVTIVFGAGLIMLVISWLRSRRQ
jgi:hypothetical protein